MNWKLERERERERLTIQSASERSSLGVHWTHERPKFYLKFGCFLSFSLIVDNCNFATVCQLLLPFSIFFCLFCLFTAIQFNCTSLAPHPPLSCAVLQVTQPIWVTRSAAAVSLLLCSFSFASTPGYSYSYWLYFWTLLTLCCVFPSSQTEWHQQQHQPLALHYARTALSVLLFSAGWQSCCCYTLCVCISPLLYFSQADDAINSKAVTVVLVVVVVVVVADVPSSHRAELKWGSSRRRYWGSRQSLRHAPAQAAAAAASLHSSEFYFGRYTLARLCSTVWGSILKLIATEDGSLSFLLLVLLLLLPGNGN